MDVAPGEKGCVVLNIPLYKIQSEKTASTTFQHGVMRVYFPEPIDLKKMQELSNSSLSFMVVRLL